MPKNGYRSHRGRSAIARRAINTNNTNGMMYQGACKYSDGTIIQPCRDGGGNIKGGSAPSGTGFMRARPWRLSSYAAKPNFLFKMNYINYHYY